MKSITKYFKSCQNTEVDYSENVGQLQSHETGCLSEDAKTQASLFYVKKILVYFT